MTYTPDGTTNFVSFPGLGIDEFAVDPVAFTVFGREVRWYGIIITFGILAAFSIFSMKIPYPVVGSLMRTCVTAPTSLPF